MAAKAPSPRSSSEALLLECAELEEELVSLKVAYEQYFMGMERFAPSKAHEAFKKRIISIRSRLKGSTAAKFRAQSLVGKFQTYERLWEKTRLDMENGNYRRDILRLRRKQGGPAAAKKASLEAVDVDTDFDDDDDLDSLAAKAEASVTKAAAAAPPRTLSGSVPVVVPLVPPSAGQPGTPAVGTFSVSKIAAPAGVSRPAAASAMGPGSRSPAPTGARPAGTLDDGKLRAVYNAYVSAKKQCREDVSSISYDSVADSLRKQVPELMKKHGASSVDFKVVIKDGKAVLRAVPK